MQNRFILAILLTGVLQLIMSISETSTAANAIGQIASRGLVNLELADIQPSSSK
jgi:hypothetical protein